MYYYRVLLPIAIKGGFVYHSENSIDLGHRVVVDFKGSRKIGVVWWETEKPPYKTKPIERVLDNCPVLDKELLDSLKFFSFYYMTYEGHFLKSALPKKLFEIKSNVDLSLINLSFDSANSPFELTEEQKNALNKIDVNKFNVNLLFGVTGSGKTEVYLQLIEEVLKRNKKSVVLVPEIALTPQYIRVFTHRFSSVDLAVLHSRLSKKEKFEQWLEFTKGKRPILIGTRSAVFVSFENVGLVVIDEENDESYKQENQPFYNAKDIAIYRAKKHDIPVILSSATPSIESMYKAETGKFNFIKLTKRVGGVDLPLVEFVKGEHEKLLSLKILEEIAGTIRRRKTVAVLINRRGFARYLVCEKCGYVFSCPNCSVSLVYHKRDSSLKCHWCDSVFKLPESCPRCGSFDLMDKGSGSQRIEEELKSKFPDASIQRFDRDVTSKKGEFERIVRELHEGRIDILVGTQMLSKGHDVSKIGLVVIADLESLFSFPDFRAFEKGVSLVIQTAGRSGRKSQGKVIVQGQSLESNLVNFIKRHDYYGFYREELKTRKLFNYPPFCRIIRIVSFASKQEKSKALIDDVFDRVKDRFITIGPSRCPIFRLRNKFRYHLIIKTQAVISTVKFLSETFKEKENIYFDVDPVSFF